MLRFLTRSIFVLSLLLGVAGSRPATAADAFTEGLLRRAILTWESGDAATAARYLELACFGLLDEPPALAGCLTHLALAQGDADDRDGFDATFARLLEVERRFAGYGMAEVPAARRERFEQLAMRWVPRETLLAVPAFQDLARRQLAEELAALPPKEQRSRLERLASEDPGEPAWRFRLAALQLADGEAAAAVQTLEGVPAGAGGEGGRCLRGRALAEAGRCAEALPTLAACGDPASTQDLATVAVRCRLAAGDLAGAAELRGRLPADWSRRGELRRLGREIVRQQRALEKAQVPAAGVAIDAGDPEGTGDVAPSEAPATAAEPQDAPPPPGDTVAPLAALPPSAEPPAQPSAEVDARLEALRGELLEAQRIDELQAAFEVARELADGYPDSASAQHLAGEIAYRMRLWQEAAIYLGRGGEDPARPELLFYRAVALYESGEAEAAAEALRRSLPRLDKTEFVRAYAAKILGTET